MEPVDLSVNRSGVGRGVILTDTRHPSPTNGIDLRVNKSSKFHLKVLGTITVCSHYANSCSEVQCLIAPADVYSSLRCYYSIDA